MDQALIDLWKQGDSAPAVEWLWNTFCCDEVGEPIPTLDLDDLSVAQHRRILLGQAGRFAKRRGCAEGEVGSLVWYAFRRALEEMDWIVSGGGCHCLPSDSGAGRFKGRFTGKDLRKKRADLHESSIAGQFYKRVMNRIRDAMRKESRKSPPPEPPGAIRIPPAPDWLRDGNAAVRRTISQLWNDQHSSATHYARKAFELAPAEVTDVVEFAFMAAIEALAFRQNAQTWLCEHDAATGESRGRHTKIVLERRHPFPKEEPEVAAVFWSEHFQPQIREESRRRRRERLGSAGLEALLEFLDAQRGSGGPGGRSRAISSGGASPTSGHGGEAEEASRMVEREDLLRLVQAFAAAATRAQGQCRAISLCMLTWVLLKVAETSRDPDVRRLVPIDPAEGDLPLELIDSTLDPLLGVLRAEYGLQSDLGSLPDAQHIAEVVGLATSGDWSALRRRLEEQRQQRKADKGGARSQNAAAAAGADEIKEAVSRHVAALARKLADDTERLAAEAQVQGFHLDGQELNRLLRRRLGFKTDNALYKATERCRDLLKRAFDDPSRST